MGEPNLRTGGARRTTSRALASVNPTLARGRSVPALMNVASVDAVKGGVVTNMSSVKF